MNFAYADPPYLGQGKKHYKEHPDAAVWDTLDGHRLLIERLVSDFPDGWALSCSTPSLQSLLPLCPRSARVAAWVKPFAIFKPGVNPAYAWEPVIFMGGRKRTRQDATIRDWHSENITLKKGLVGVKPPNFNKWIIDLLGADPKQDDFHDLFPGKGGFSAAWEALK